METQETQETQETNNPETGSEAIEIQAITQPAMTEDQEAPAMTEEAPETEETPTTYVDGKFKSVSDLEDSYKELQSTFSKKLGDFSGSPEEYTYDSEVELTGDEQFMIDNLQTWGKDNQLSQDGFESLVQQYTEWNDNANETRLNAEFEKLGKNGQERLTNITDYLKQNIGQEMTDSLAKNMLDAASIEGIEKLIGLSQAPAPTVAPAAAAMSKEKLTEMRFAVDENGERRMSSDPSYRNKILRLEAQAG